MQFSPFSRRKFLVGSAALASAASLPSISLALNPINEKLHGLSAFGDLKYPSDYKHFDDAVLDAPKGGTLSFTPSNWGYNQNISTFNTLNTFVRQGDAPPRMELCYDTLMAGSPDEPDSLYCTLSSSVEISADRNTYRFELRPEAVFHDGTPVTAEDVSFSYSILKDKGHPSFIQTLRNLSEAAVISERVVELRFDGEQSDRAILSSVGIPILSKAYHADNPIEASTLTPPLSSGAWKVGRLSAGKFIEYERVKGHWAENMPFSIGFGHFDILRIEFFRDRIAPFEAFKKGEILWREEFTSKVWATEYNFPAVEDGRVKLEEFAQAKTPSMQGWAVNSRKAKFSDPRTREAIGLCFDFEWTNKNLFYGIYTRGASIFEKSEFKAEGKPGSEELALMEPIKASIPQAAFDEVFVPNVTDGTGKDRNPLRQALKLLTQAGWKRENGKLVNKSGEVLSVEFLIRAPVFERVLGNYVQNLKKIGVDATIRLVDPTQFQARLNEYDFDIVGIAGGFGASPTAESLRFSLHSESADISGSRNYPGIRSEAIDALLQRMKTVSNREELITILRTIDRVLRPMHLWIPNWYSANHRVAFWDVFGWQEPKPDYMFAPEALWWFDEEKAKAIGKA